MMVILEELSSYVPVVTTEESVNDPECGTTTLPNDDFHHILFGGDQLTAARARGSLRIRSNAERSMHRLEGLIPTSEDWHTKVVFIQVCRCVLAFIGRRAYCV